MILYLILQYLDNCTEWVRQHVKQLCHISIEKCDYKNLTVD